MKKTIQIIIILCLFFYNNSIVNAQTYDIYPIIENGSTDERINFVILADGYTVSELIDFQADAQKVSDDLFQTSPFKEYKDFFNFYGIGSISNESGVDHPGTATDVTEPASPITEVDNLLNCTFDRADIHRLLAPSSTTNLNTVLANNFPNYDERLILCNSDEYGGAGGSYAVASTNASSAAIMVHEIGHSFAGLGDEYWAGDNFIGERPNRTQETNPTLVKWKNWIGDQGIGIFQHCCSAVAQEWYRPHQSCKMRFINSPYCAVCKEAFINEIYNLVSPISTTSPSEGSVTVSNSQTFSLNLILPNPNTLNIEWTLNGNPIGNNNSITISASQLNNGGNELQARVVDNTPMSRTHMDGNPLEFFATWNLTSGSTGGNCDDNLSGYTYLGEQGESKYFISNEEMKWQAAQTQAAAQDGYLVSISSQTENDFLLGMINEIVFIGINDVQEEGILAWDNGESVGFNNIADQNLADKDFGKMNFWNGKWGWDNEYVSRKHILELPCDQGCPCPTIYDPVCGSNGVTYSNSCEAECAGVFDYTFGECNSNTDCPNDISGFAAIGEYGDSKYYLSDEISRPTDAQVLAESLGGYLVAIGSDGENNFIQQNISEMVYIGLNDEVSEGDLEWFNGEALTYNNINPCSFCEANSVDLDFVIMAPWDGRWSFSNLYNQRKYVIEIPCDNSGGGNRADLTLANLENVATNMTKGTVEEFEFDLKNIGTVTATESYTIGMYISNDNIFSNDDILSGEINTANTFVGTDSNVPAAITVPNVASGNYYLILVADINNSVDESNENNNSILKSITIGEGNNNGCQSTTIDGFTYLGRFSNHDYYLSDEVARPSEAQSICTSHGGYLASISLPTENDFIQQRIDGLAYIGLHDENSEGELQWRSGEVVDYTNIDACSFCETNNEELDYVVMQGWNGGWSFSNFWNQRKYVLEIPCSSNLSNGNPLLLLPNNKSGKPDFINLVPNPANEYLGVQLNAEKELNIDIQIFNARGRLVKAINTDLFEGLNGIEIDIVDLPSGVYWIKVLQAQYYNSTKRFVKVKN